MFGFNGFLRDGRGHELKQRDRSSHDVVPREHRSVVVRVAHEPIVQMVREEENEIHTGELKDENAVRYFHGQEVFIQDDAAR